MTDAIRRVVHNSSFVLYVDGDEVIVSASLYDTTSTPDRWPRVSEPIQ